MTVKTYRTTQLYPINIPFELYIKWQCERGAEGNGWWFTRSGKGRVSVDKVSWSEIGQLDKKDDDQIIKMMVNSRCDFLTDGTEVYTRMAPGLVRVTDLSFIHRMIQSWKAGSDGFTTWEAKDTYREDIDNLRPIKE